MKIQYPVLSLALFSAILASNSSAAVLITQYYEGPSTNKWIEITNTGTTSVDLGAGVYKLSLWNNAAAENYKTNGTPTQTMALTGSLAPGASFIYGNTSNTTPSYAVPLVTATNNNVMNFNGNDSIALWSGATFTTVSLVDAVGFTNVGNEGVDKSFVRLNESAGWNTVAGSDATDFGSVWQLVALATVDSAAVSTDARIGYSSVPEANVAALFGAVGVLGLLRRRRY